MSQLRITEIIQKDPELKQIYDTNGCFKFVVAPKLLEADKENELITAIRLLATLSETYEMLIETIAQHGNEEFKNKCRKALNELLESEE